MDLRGQWRGWGRAAVAISVLYALLVAAFVPAPIGLPTSDPLASLCLHAGSDASGDPSPAGHVHRGCCTAALHAAALPPPDGAFVPIRWGAYRIAFASSRPEAELPRTGPPVRATSPRGPPLA